MSQLLVNQIPTGSAFDSSPPILLPLLDVNNVHFRCVLHSNSHTWLHISTLATSDFSKSGFSLQVHLFSLSLMLTMHVFDLFLNQIFTENFKSRLLLYQIPRGVPFCSISTILSSLSDANNIRGFCRLPYRVCMPMWEGSTHVYLMWRAEL